jgi:hypothetical protein
MPISKRTDKSRSKPCSRKRRVAQKGVRFFTQPRLTSILAALWVLAGVSARRSGRNGDDRHRCPRADVVFVVALHLLRIFTVILFAPIFARSVNK